MRKTNASVKALRAFAREKTIPKKHVERHFRQILGTNDRLVAIVMASALEHTLETLLEASMPKGSDGLFEVNQPLQAFSSKIRLAYSLGLIGADIRQNLDYIREIRNAFAHHIGPITFATPEVKAVCKLLIVAPNVRPTAVKSSLMWFRLACGATGRTMAEHSGVGTT
jgi:hypothetical protein